MDNFSEQLNQLLQNPESLKQMMEMASALSSSFGSHAAVPPSLPQLDPKIQNQIQNREQKQQALVQALLPYLRPSRRAKLQRAVELAHLSQLAGATLQAGHPAAPEKEEQRV